LLANCWPERREVQKAAAGWRLGCGNNRLANTVAKFQLHLLTPAFCLSEFYDPCLGIVAFSQTDFTEALKTITVPVLVMHSEDDQIVPYQAAGPLSAKLLKNGTLKTYKDFPHGMPTTHADVINADLLAFIKS